MFVNGGFEEGTYGWQKFGGELQAIGSPRRSGDRAGAFSSNTSSTKWAFQAVRIDPALAYEFEGFLQTEAGIAQAFLRISWYESPNAGGQAIATDDSTTKVGGASTGFVRVGTGPRRPPANAQTARLRVMLVPDGTTPTTLHLDDFAFGVAMPGTPVPPSATAAPDEPFEAPQAAQDILSVRSGDVGAPQPAPAGTEASFAEVASVREAAPPLSGVSPESAVDSRQEAGSNWEIALGGVVFALALGVANFFARRRRA